MEKPRTAPDIFREAGRQIRTGWIPALIAVIASSLIARLGTVAFIGLALTGAVVVALRRYRVVLERRRAEP